MPLFLEEFGLWRCGELRQGDLEAIVHTRPGLSGTWLRPQRLGSKSRLDCAQLSAIKPGFPGGMHRDTASLNGNVDFCVHVFHIFFF